VNSCSGDNIEKTSLEHGHGRSKTVDAEAQSGAGEGSHSGKNDGCRGQSCLRYAALGDRGMERRGQARHGKRVEGHPVDVREQYERQIKEVQEACGEAMLELRARKKLASLLGEEEK